MHRFAFCGLIGLLLLVLTSCGLREDLDTVQDITLRPEIAVPLLNTTFDIDSLLPRLNEQGVTVGNEADGLITLSFEDSLFRFSARELLLMNRFQVPVVDTVNEIPLPLLGGGQITSAAVRQGGFFYGFGIGAPGSYRMVINLPDAQRNGQPLTITREVSGPATVVGDTVLDGYEFVMPDGTFGFEYTLLNLDTGTEVEPQAFAVGLDTTRFSSVEGRMNAHQASLQAARTPTDFFRSFTGNSVQVVDPRMEVVIDNGIGLPLTVAFETFAGLNAAGDSVLLQNQTLADGLDLAYPRLSERGQLAQTTLRLDNSNANMSDLLALLPTHLGVRYRLSLRTPDAGQPQFIDEDNLIHVRVRNEVPLHFSTPGLSYADTFRLNSEFPPSDLVEWAEFKLITENGLPLGSELQIYFFDENRQLIDSLYDDGNRLFSPAAVNSEGLPTNVVPHELRVMLTRAEYDRFSQASFLGYRIFLNTTDQGAVPVKLTSGQQLGIKLGLRAVINANRDLYDSLMNTTPVSGGQ